MTSDLLDQVLLLWKSVWTFFLILSWRALNIVNISVSKNRPIQLFVLINPTFNNIVIEWFVLSDFRLNVKHTMLICSSILLKVSRGKCLKIVQQETLMLYPDLTLLCCEGSGFKITIDFQRSTAQCMKNNFPTSILILTFTVLDNIKFV